METDVNQSAEPAEVVSPKKPYASPELDLHGSVETLTEKLPPTGHQSPAGISDEGDTTK